MWWQQQQLRRNIGRTLFDINGRNIFSDLSPKAKEIKPKTNKWNLNKLKSFCTAKKANKMKRKSTKWEKIFANGAADKG